ncbi:MAG: BC1881 family protein [Oscillospiraceae bacterium]|nr:BC1881 family protein [Oscillospiraceae bacterium]
MESKAETTAALVEELEKREGVETHIVEPYADFEVKVNGPAIVLVITD